MNYLSRSRASDTLLARGRNSTVPFIAKLGYPSGEGENQGSSFHIFPFTTKSKETAKSVAIFVVLPTFMGGYRAYQILPRLFFAKI